MALLNLFRKRQPPPLPEPAVKPAFLLSNHLPQPADESIIAQKFGALKDLLGDHVNIFYRSLEGAESSWANSHTFTREVEEELSDDDSIDAPVLQNTPYPRGDQMIGGQQQQQQQQQQQHAPANSLFRDQVKYHPAVPLNYYSPVVPPPPHENKQQESVARSWEKHIQFMIARAIIHRVDPYRDETDSFLPFEIVQFLRALPENDHSEGTFI